MSQLVCLSCSLRACITFMAMHMMPVIQAISDTMSICHAASRHSTPHVDWSVQHQDLMLHLLHSQSRSWWCRLSLPASDEGDAEAHAVELLVELQCGLQWRRSSLGRSNSGTDCTTSEVTWQEWVVGSAVTVRGSLNSLCANLHRAEQISAKESRLTCKHRTSHDSASGH